MSYMLISFLSLALSSFSWSTEEVPAQGKQEVLLTVSKSTAWQLSAESASGTSCVLVGRTHGPMRQSGSPGESNCLLNEVLEEGDYRLLLESLPNGQGKVRLSAKPFEEVNAVPLFLPPGSSTSVQLRPLQQATFWFEVKEAKAPGIRVVGKTLWRAVLRRNGQWWMGQNPSEDLKHASGNRELFWAENLEPGVYALQVWGLASDSTEAKVDETLSVYHEHFTLPEEGFQAWEMPASGVLSLGFADGMQTAVLRMNSQKDAKIQTQFYEAELEGKLIRRRSKHSECTLDGEAVGKVCTFRVRQQQTPSMLVLRGKPGATGSMEWLSNAERKERVMERASSRYQEFSLEKGSYAFFVEDFPSDEDAVSLGCMLEQVAEEDFSPSERIAFSGLELSPQEKFQQRFNYNGNFATFWFRWLAKGELHIGVGGELGTRCSVYAVSEDGEQTIQENAKGKPFACGDKLSLLPGLYSVQLNGGSPGIESLRMEGEKSRLETPSKSPKASCIFPKVSLKKGRYRLHTNRNAQVFRLYSWSALPLDTQHPVRFVLSAREQVKLPLKNPHGLALYAPSKQPFGCILNGKSISAEGGECLLPSANSGELGIENPGDTPLSFILQSPVEKAAPIPLQHSLPARPAWIELKAKTPRYFSFDRKQSHSALVRVSKPGLYRLETTGLLSTHCELWTPLSGRANAVSMRGRGRNCLLYGYLERGSYLAQATVQGESRGRAGLLLSEYPSVEVADIHLSRELFSSIAAGHLVHQKVNIATAGDYQLESFVEGGADLSCRLEDEGGWPQDSSRACSRTLSLEPGQYVWTQFPLEIDSNRRTRLSKVVSESIVSGEAVQPIEFFTDYRIKLGDNGKNAFRFLLQGHSNLRFFLSNKMQARLFLEEEGKEPEFIELIKPNPLAVDGFFSSGNEEGAEPYEAGEYESDDGGEYESHAPGTSYSSERQRDKFRVSEEPPGIVLSLKPGRYLLVAEHSLGDVGVDWSLWLGSSVVLPGMKKTVSLPAQVPIGLAEAGLLSVRTDSSARSHCQLRDEQGKLVLESHPSLPNWNCSFTHKLNEGSYVLHIENPSYSGGMTALTLDLLPVSKKYSFENEQKISLEHNAVELMIPKTTEALVWRVEVSGDTPFSCLLSNAKGERFAEQHQTHECKILLRPKEQEFRLQLWTQLPSANLTARLVPLSIAWGKKAQNKKSAVGLQVERPGHYATASGAFCIEEDETGILRSCGPSASLQAGKWIFAHENNRGISLKMEEKIQKEAFSSKTLELSSNFELRRLQSPKTSIFLLWGKAQNQELSPLCELEGTKGLGKREKGKCYAAGLGKEALAKLSSPLAPAMSVRAQWGFVAIPSKAEPLPLGKTQLSFPSGVGLFSLPSEKINVVDMVLAPYSWAVLLDGEEQVVALCLNENQFQVCSLKGKSDRLLLISSAVKAELTVGQMDKMPETPVLGGLFEALPSFSGTAELKINASPQKRNWEAIGAESCMLMLDNGYFQTKCQGQIPPNVQGELSLKHTSKPLRVVAFERDKEDASFGRPSLLPIRTEMLPNTRESLPAQGMSRLLVLNEDATVYMTANTGVCALLQGDTLLATDGMARGCHMLRWLKAGSYQWEVRPFANQQLQGVAFWTQEKTSQLKENIGEETWLLPQASKLLGFRMETEGYWGFGVQAMTEAFECKLFDEKHRFLGDGCQQYQQLPQGKYWLAVTNILENQPAQFRPVVFGMEAAPNEVPEEYLRDLFLRAGESN